MSKALLLASLLMLLVSQIYISYRAEAADVSITDDWYTASKRVMDNLPETLPDDLQPQNSLNADDLHFASSVARSAEKHLIGEMMKSVDLTGLSEETEKLVVFISFSIPRVLLRSILEEGAANQATFVLQGFAPGATTFRQNIEAVNELLDGLDPFPTVILNPSLYKNWNIEVVPTLVVEKGGTQLARYSGEYSTQWLLEQREKSPDTVDFGTIGHIWEIDEANLIDVMKERVAKIDWQEKKETALKNFWKKKDFIELAQATETTEFSINPSIRVTQDILGKEGEIVARAGDVMNPLHSIPFTSAIVVFDGTNEKQVNFIIKRAREEYPNKKVIYITSRAARDDGFTFMSDLEQRIGKPVYLLNTAILKRFQLTHSPSFIHATRSEIIVRSIPAL